MKLQVPIENVSVMKCPCCEQEIYFITGYFEEVNDET